MNLSALLISHPQQSPNPLVILSTPQRSRLERQMNLDIVWCVVILVVLCIVGAAGCKFWLSTFTTDAPVPFLPSFKEPIYEGMLTFWTFVIILQVMIPLSLYVTMEMAKVGQVYHIGHDTSLFDPVTGRKAECRALNITEELGQVSYLGLITQSMPNLVTI